MSLSEKKILLKTISYRVFATLVTFFGTWFITGNVNAGLTIGVFDVVSKLIAYYIHEKIWESKWKK